MRLPFAVSLLFATALGCAPSVAQPGAPRGQPAATVAVAPVVQGEVMPRVTLVGAVIAARRSIVGSAVDGRVVELHVDAGDSVAMIEEGGRRVGQPIAQMLTATISIEIAAAEAELELQRQELAELEAGTRSEEIAQTEARWEAAKANEKYAQARYARLQILYEETRTVSQEEFEEARSAAHAVAQELLAVKAAHELALAGPRKEQIAQAQARLARQQEEVRRLEDMRKKYTIRAPFIGHVVAKHTEVGAWLSRGDPVAEIAELDPVDIEVQVPESLVAQLRIGDKVPVIIDALGPDENQFTGSVDRVIPSADLRARTFPVMIRLANPQTEDGLLLFKAGMLARATVSGRPYSALLVPKDALVLGGRTPVVVAVAHGPDGGSVARVVEVQRGESTDGSIEVRGDLQVGQQVIVRGNERVQHGQPLMIIDES